MADLITRPDNRPDTPAVFDTVTAREDTLAERLLTTQSPQRPQSTPAFRIEVDGRLITGLEGQTILEVCRDNGIEVPTLCYEPKLPGFGACRMCVVEVEGEEHPPISCSRACEPGMVVQTQTEELRQIRKTNLELIFSDHNAYCLPPCQNKCPSHIDIPGFLKANTEGNLRESARIFKRTIPFPRVLGRVCPAPCEEHCRRDEVEEAIAIRDSHRYAGDQVLKAEADEGIKAPVPFEVQAEDRRKRRGHRLRAGRHVGRLLPPDRRPRRDRLRARPGARRHAPLRHPPVPPAQGRGPRGRVRVRDPASAARSCATPGWAATSPSTTSRTRASTRSAWPSAATRRTSWACPARRPTASSTAWSTCASRRSACPTRATPASASWSSAAASPRWTARAPRSARARRK